MGHKRLGVLLMVGSLTLSGTVKRSVTINTVSVPIIEDVKIVTTGNKVVVTSLK